MPHAVKIGGVLLGLLLTYMMVGPLLIYGLIFFLSVLYLQLVVYQENMLYIPKPQGYTTCDKNPTGMKSPAEYHILFQNVNFDAPDGVRLHAWWIPSVKDSGSCPTILFCHANAGNIGFRLPNMVKLRDAFGGRLNIFAFDYRGYGSSDMHEKPDEVGLTLDAIGAAQWLTGMANKAEVDRSRIYVFGRSLGGAVAVSLAHALENTPDSSLFAPKGIILENTFMSISSAVDHVFPWIPTALKNKFLRLRWESEKKIGAIRAPFLLLSGLKDEIIPASQMSSLRDLCTSEKTFVSFPDGTHNDTWEKGGERYFQAWIDFIR